MLVFNLTKWCIHKVLEFRPLHNHVKYVLHLSLFDNLCSGKNDGGCEQNGCGEKMLESEYV